MSELMRAAVIERMGTSPALREVPVPTAADGQQLLTVSSAALNPLDLVMSTGVHGAQQVPYIAGSEAVGTLPDGRRVYAPMCEPRGALAEHALAEPGETYPLPDGLADGDALAAGIAGSTGWHALTWKAGLQPGESVLVTGATGSVGRVVVQAAKLKGAARVVAAGRDATVLERLLDRGADEIVVLGDDDEQRLIDASRRGGRAGFDVVVDSLFGEPMTAAMAATADHGRVVNLGMRAGRTVTLNGLVSKGRDLLSFSLAHVPRDVAQAGFAEMCAHITAGRLLVDTETLPLDEIARAWDRQAQGVHTKIVVTV